MNYDYNGNLTFEERVGLITKDLMNYGLDKELALKVASIEEPINDNNRYESEYKRLYNILRLSNDDRIKNKVISDMFNIYEEGRSKKIDSFITDLKVYIEYNADLPELK